MKRPQSVSFHDGERSTFHARQMGQILVMYNLMLAYRMRNGKVNCSELWMWVWFIALFLNICTFPCVEGFICFLFKHFDYILSSSDKRRIYYKPFSFLCFSFQTNLLHGIYWVSAVFCTSLMLTLGKLTSSL